MKRLEYRVFNNHVAMFRLVAQCGGSDNVRYGRAGPEKLYLAELDVHTGARIWLFVHVPGDGHLAAVVNWHDNLWTAMANHGIQPTNCPLEVWAGPARELREKIIPSKPMPFHAAMERHLMANPGTTHLAEFTVPQ